MPDPVDSMQPVRFTEVEPAKESEPVPMKTKSSMGLKLLLTLMIVLAGIGSGYALEQFLPQASSTTKVTAPENPNEVKVGAVYGEQDKSKFKDPAEGVLVHGGIDGEGSHHLLRPGGKSQNVYITSTVLDLTLFENHLVEVAGDTYASQKAGWLMDVGRVEVKQLNAEKPFEEEAPTEVGAE